MGHLVANTKWMNIDRLNILLENANPSESYYRTAYDSGKHFEKGSIDIETGFLLYSLIRRIRPEVPVVAGTNLEVVSSWIGCALADNVESWQHGTVYPLNVIGTKRYELWNKLGINMFFKVDVLCPKNIDFIYFNNPDMDYLLLDLIPYSIKKNCVCVIREKSSGDEKNGTIIINSIDGLKLYGVNNV